MGTNYYLYQATAPTCPTCGHAPTSEPLHIGKSSAGWCFALHVIPDEGINSLDDWKRAWNAAGAFIKDEYGDAVTGDEMLETITERSGRNQGPMPPGWYRESYAEPGPNGLARHIIGPHCVRHGDGTWDLIPGEFS